MADCVTLSPTNNPSKILNAYKNSVDESLQVTLETLLKRLKIHGFNRLTHFFLENMLCEIYRHLDEGTRKSLKETKAASEYLNIILKKGLEMPEYFDRVINATKSAKYDVYFKDTFLNDWQHLFSIVERKNTLQLEMRPSTSSNQVNSTCSLKIYINYDEHNKLSVEGVPKGDITSYFIK